MRSTHNENIAVALKLDGGRNSATCMPLADFITNSSDFLTLWRIGRR